MATIELSLKKPLVLPGLEPGTFRVLGERDNHYTTEHLFGDISNHLPTVYQLTDCETPRMA